MLEQRLWKNHATAGMQCIQLISGYHADLDIFENGVKKLENHYIDVCILALYFHGPGQGATSLKQSQLIVVRTDGNVVVATS